MPGSTMSSGLEAEAFVFVTNAATSTGTKITEYHLRGGTNAKHL
jgi:hypothetical protein